MSSGAITRLGIVGCDVRDHTVSAVMDMPGVFAIRFEGRGLRVGRRALRSEDIVASRADLLGVT